MFRIGGRGSTRPSVRRMPMVSFCFVGVRDDDGPQWPGIQSSPNSSAQGTISPKASPMSSTEWAITPATGCNAMRFFASRCPLSCCPPYGSRPWLGLKPYLPTHMGGIRTLPPMSVPKLRVVPRRARRAASPPVLPPTVRRRLRGFRVRPKRWFAVSRVETV